MKKLKSPQHLFAKTCLALALGGISLAVTSNAQPVAAAFSQRIEAETLSQHTGNVYIRHDGDKIPIDTKGNSITLNNASGHQFVDFSDPVADTSSYLNTIPAGQDSATWQVQVPKAGFYQLRFNYNNPATETKGNRNDRDERNFRVMINNSTDPLSDAGWAGWMIFNISGYKDANTPQSTVQSTDNYAAVRGNTKWNNNYMTVHLNAGTNTITLALQAPPGQAVFDGPNLDFFDVTDVSDQYATNSEIPYVAKDFKFAHPGISYTAKTLDRIRANKDNTSTIDGKAYAQLKASPLAAADYQPDPQALIDIGPYNNPNIGGDHLTKDSFAASSNALMWYFDRDSAHAKTAINILNAWTNTLTTVGHGNDAKLRFALDFPEMLNAAELLKNVYNTDPTTADADKWQPADIARFDAFVKSMMIARGGTYSPTVDYYPQANGGWDALIGAFNMSAAVYLNDVDLYNAALQQFYLGNAQNPNGVSEGALLSYIYPTGELQETSRDQAHVQLGINGLALQAAISWNQGIDLFSAYNSRLLAGVAYTAKYNLGEDVPSETFASDLSRGKANDGTPAYEIVANHYLTQQPMTTDAVQSVQQAADTLSRAPIATNEGGQHINWLQAALYTTD
ncbi:alginate lyase family protein [Agrilactobacillus composti]|nr:alginate lyase family protein [Agrilactobacillus composti]